MKRIVLKIDDDVYRDLSSAMSVRGLTGEAYGIVDEMFIKLMQAMEKGDEEKHFFFPKDRERD